MSYGSLALEASKWDGMSPACGGINGAIELFLSWATAGSIPLEWGDRNIQKGEAHHGAPIH